MSEELRKMFEKEEKHLSRERRAEIDRAGETVSRFMIEHSSEEVDRYLERLSRQELITFLTAGLWNCYKFFENRKGVKA